ncbi:MarR family winged helix-turn-helix transcriptional regulator [Gordonia neofelifaecis]|uniref:Regulatory protein MarR n=1 Tax=Gordonia neofelifaecis NRRL B-59395 TaxID=644548 RepID=F1YGT6_9ACTN|nr:MarR family transcriptional regulator [Gordonia neofelifaecis]EGD56234.1 regulatory protein MarR [Gordonia neofelifaecis NRRL B-59395]
MPDNEETLVDVRSLHHRLVRINRVLRLAGSGSGLSAGTAAALWSITQHAPLRLSRLAEIESVSTPAISRIVTSLESMGYVERRADPDDARARLLYPTDAGRDVMSTARNARVLRLAEALDRLEPADRDMVERAFEVLSDALVPPEA